jgi:hypothetical protein
MIAADSLVYVEKQGPCFDGEIHCCRMLEALLWYYSPSCYE